MTKTIENLFLLLIACSELLFIVLFFVFFKRTKAEKGLWAILVYCLFDLAVQYTIDHVASKTVHFLYAFFTLAEFSFFSYFLWVNIKNKVVRKIIPFSIIAFILFLIIYYTTTDFRSLDSVPVGVETILILIFSFYYLYEQMNDTSNLFVYSKYQFWIIAGFMLYLSGSFFIYIFANQVDRQVLDQFWALTYIFLILKNILFSIAILIHVKRKEIPSPRNLYPYLN